MSTSHRPSKVFTVEQANAMLPLIKAIASDLVALSREVVERQQRLTALPSGRDLEDGDPYGDELSQMERELDQDAATIRDYARELEELGVELKDPLTGLIDFPHEMDGRIVYLCWRLGESEVLFWHELKAGFRGRQPLTAAAVDDGPE